MAIYIDDSGSHGLDAGPIDGVENTDWSRDATNQTFKLLTDTGSADTGFTLSSTTGWILIESYNINGNDAGTVMWRSLTAWQSDVSTSTVRNTAMTDFRTDMATIISGTNITTYDAKCTYFDGTDAHVYEADEATAFPDEASPTYTVTDYSPTSSLFTITNTLVAPIESATTSTFATFTTSATTPDPLVMSIKASSGKKFWVNDSEYTGNGATSVAVSEAGIASLTEFTIEEEDFDDMTSITIDNQDLTGSVPDLKGRTNFSYIDLRNNHLTGAIPSFDSDNSAITAMYMYGFTGTGLTGTLPSSVSFLSNVGMFNWSNTNLSGTIPDLGGMTSLTHCYLHDNDFTGYTPAAGGKIYPTGTFTISGSDLTSATDINAILADLKAGQVDTGDTAVTVNLSGGTNAAPTGQGLTDKAALITIGWTVTTN